jgi:tetratricopeptide (TPR) repeat protein
VNPRILLSLTVLMALLPWSALAETSMEGAVQSASSGKAQPVRDAYELLRDGAYNDERLETLESLYAQANQALEEAVLPSEPQALWRSRIEYMAARGYQSHSSKAEALAHFEKGLGFAETALKLNQSSEAWRMRSEHLSQMCLLKGTGYLMANGTKVIAFAEKALQLDPANAAARVIVANSKIYPPALFGGNPAAGIRLMQEALARGNAARDDLFNIYSGIGVAYEKLKDAAAAREWVLKALELYPSNLFAQKQYSHIAR